MFITVNNVLSSPEFARYRYVTANELDFHRPTYEEIPKIEKYVKSMQSLVWSVYAIISFMLLAAFTILSFETGSFTMLLVPLCFIGAFYPIFLLIRSLYNDPSEIACGRMLGYRFLQEAIVAVDSQGKIVKIGRKRNEAEIPMNAEVYILHFKCGYCLCYAYEK